MLHTSDICCCLDTIMEMWVFFKKSIIKGAVHMSRAKSLLFNNITFYLAWWQASTLLKPAMTFNFSSPEFLSHDKMRKNHEYFRMATPANMLRVNQLRFFGTSLVVMYFLNGKCGNHTHVEIPLFIIIICINLTILSVHMSLASPANMAGSNYACYCQLPP